ncbi:MAG: hypothetical protein GKR90_19625 [Pseudomonadales bacterium]|nr:hypothetical protein [Pseudomonadales bacterium]
MLQQVNLLSTDLLPQQPLLEFRQMLVALAAFVVVLLTLSSVKGFEVWQGFVDTEALEEDLVLLLAQIKGVDAKTALQAELDALNTSKADRLAELDVLKVAKRVGGFSDQLVVLAESRVTGLWLTDFSFVQVEGSEPHLSVVGVAHQPELVGQFLRELQSHGGFSGYQFSELEIQREAEEKLAHFSLLGQEIDVDGAPG